MSPSRLDPPLPEPDPGIGVWLEDAYARCLCPGRLDRDPLAIARRYVPPADFEVAAFVCSLLAFGRVDLIMAACERAMVPLGPQPAEGLMALGDRGIAKAYERFRYRFCAPADMIALMRGLRRILSEAGSLEAAFPRPRGGRAGLPASLSAFVARLGGGFRPNLLPDPLRGSACKRPFLMLRWLVRSRDVDRGHWTVVSPAELVLPLDVHMGRICAGLGFIGKGAGLKDALRATEALARYEPLDPLKYDFALTRLGIDPREGDPGPYGAPIAEPACRSHSP